MKFLFCILTVTEERSRIRSWIRSGSISHRYGAADPDPHQNVTDPQHCLEVLSLGKPEPIPKL
jgi:fatty-acid desaturase